jgi:GT2 family glycosyltransferase
MAQPILEIITPNYNYSNYLSDCLNSTDGYGSNAILHTVVDGKSSDFSHEILNQALHQKGNLNWIKKIDENQADAINIALAHSKSKWIGWLNSDEFYTHDCLELVLKLIKDPNEYDVIYGDALFCDTNKKFIRIKSAHRYNRKVLENYGAYISTCSFFVRREFIESLGPEYLDPKLRISLDWDFFLRLFRMSPKVYVVKKNLGVFRIHSAAITQQTNSEDKIREFEYVVEKNQIKTNMRVGKTLHRLLKLSSSAYFREFYQYIRYRKQSF